VVIAKLQADELIRITLKEKETLLKEIHHRVKNNMQVISSLISLQAAKATEPETVEMLKESQGRIRSMALIHEKLYRSDSLAEINFGDYVDSMIDELLQIFTLLREHHDHYRCRKRPVRGGHRHPLRAHH